MTTKTESLEQLVHTHEAMLLGARKALQEEINRVAAKSKKESDRAAFEGEEDENTTYARHSQALLAIVNSAECSYSINVAHDALYPRRRK